MSPLESTDSNSEALAQLLFAAYLVLTLIMLINMLIALLSNTYQGVQVIVKNFLLLEVILLYFFLFYQIPNPFNSLKSSVYQG